MRNFVLRLLLLSFLLLQCMPIIAAEDKLKTYIGNISGTITVLANGQVAAVELKNVNDEALDKFLTNVVKKWKFSPMRINGQPVDVTTSFSFNAITSYDSQRIIKSIEYSHIYFEKSQFEKQQYNALNNIHKREEVKFPRDALRFGLSSLVTVVVKISPEGMVVDAAVSDMALLGVEDKGGNSLKSFAEKTFAREALYALKQWSWSPDELQYYKCQNGCVRAIVVNYVMDDRPTWQAYSSIKMPIPDWVIAESQSNQIYDLNSQLVRLMRSANNTKIENGG
jgi:uncharacterized protein YfkK (UPF0435 family)